MYGRGRIRGEWREREGRMILTCLGRKREHEGKGKGKLRRLLLITDWKEKENERGGRMMGKTEMMSCAKIEIGKEMRG